jgi:hypothetical protein
MWSDVCFSDRREAVRGGCGENFRFCALRKKNRSTCDTHDKLDEDYCFVAGFIEKRDAGRRLGAVAPKGRVFATGLVSRG